VKKKAALTLLRLYRKYPEVLPVTEWAQRIVSIMDDEDLGVVISVTSLVMAMAQDNLDAFSVCYQKAIDRLHKVCFFLPANSYLSPCVFTSLLLIVNTPLLIRTTEYLHLGYKSSS